MRVLFAEFRGFWFAVDRYVTLQLGILRATTSVLHRNGENKKLRNTELVSWGLTIVSLFCLPLIVVLTFFYKPTGAFLPRQLAISLFIAICCLGATAAVLPSKCSRIFHHKQISDNRLLERTGSNQLNQGSIVLNGHHPTCGRFAAHVLQVRGKVYCAGCLGLLTGALIAMTGSFAYSISIIRVQGEAAFVFWSGFVAVLVGLLQYTKPFMVKSSIHYLLNVVFVAGAFFLLIGVIEMNGTCAVEMYVLVIILYWILTRIVLSNLEHQKTCVVCGLSSCTYFPR